MESFIAIYVSLRVAYADSWILTTM